MNTITKEIAKEFCIHCRWAQHVWRFRTCLFDNNPHLELIEEAKIAPFFCVIHEMASEYWMLQISKLHDPAKTGNKENLSLSFITQNWRHDEEIKTELERLRLEMEKFYCDFIKEVRNKVAVHNDLGTVLLGGYVGEFPENEDEKYFEHLKNFAEIVNRSVLGKQFSYSKTTRTDVGVMMEKLRWAKKYSEPPKH